MYLAPKVTKTSQCVTTSHCDSEFSLLHYSSSTNPYSHTTLCQVTARNYPLNLISKQHASGSLTRDLQCNMYYFLLIVWFLLTCLFHYCEYFVVAENAVNINFHEKEFSMLTLLFFSTCTHVQVEKNWAPVLMSYTIKGPFFHCLPIHLSMAVCQNVLLL